MQKSFTYNLQGADAVEAKKEQNIFAFDTQRFAASTLTIAVSGTSSISASGAAKWGFTSNSPASVAASALTLSNSAGSSSSVSGSTWFKIGDSAALAGSSISSIAFTGFGAVDSVNYASSKSAALHLNASNSQLSVDSVIGEFVYAPTGTALASTINGATLSASFSAGAIATLTGSSDGNSLGISLKDATVNALDGSQYWVANGTTGSLVAGNYADFNSLSGTATMSGEYTASKFENLKLDLTGTVSLNSGASNSIALQVAGSGNAAYSETVTLKGLGAVESMEETKNALVVTAKDSGTALTVGGGYAYLGESASASVLANGIATVSSLAGDWVMGNKQSAAYLVGGATSSATLTFATVSGGTATVSAAKGDGAVLSNIKLASAGQTDVTVGASAYGSVASWTIGGASANALFNASASNGYSSVTLSGADVTAYGYTSGGGSLSVVGGADGGGTVSGLTNNKAVSIVDSLIATVGALDSGGYWALGTATDAYVGTSQVWTFGTSGATVGNLSRAGDANYASLNSAFGNKMTLTGAVNWSVDADNVTASSATVLFDSTTTKVTLGSDNSGSVFAYAGSDATVAGAGGTTSVAGLAAGAGVTVGGSSISAIDAFAASGYWAVKTTSSMNVGTAQSWAAASTVTIANTTAATAAGADKLIFGTNTTVSVTTGGAADWSLSGTSSAAITFDTTYGTATVSSTASLSASTTTTIVGGTGSKGGTVAGVLAEANVNVVDGAVNSIGGLASGGTWTFGQSGGASLAGQQWVFNKSGAVLANTGADEDNSTGKADKLDLVSGTATLGNVGETLTSFTANGVLWDTIQGFASTAGVVFDANGNVGVSASSTSVMSVFGAAGANVSVNAASYGAGSSSTVIANAATVGVANDGAYILTLDEEDAGVSGVLNLASGATLGVTNDTLFGVGTGTLISGTIVRGAAAEPDNKIEVAFSTAKALDIYNVVSGDNYGGTNLTASNGTVTYNLSAGSSADEATAITVGADSVSLSITNAQGSTADLDVITSGNSNITSIRGLKIGDTVISSDSEMTLTFATDVALSKAISAGSAAVITANDIKISIDAMTDLAVASSTVVVNVASNNDGVADTNDKATITGLSNGATVSAGAGTYTWKGKSGTGMITEASGVLYLDGSTLIAMDQSAVAAASAAEAQKDALSTIGSGSEAADAYKAFMGGIAKATSNASTNTTVVGFTDGATVSGSVSTDASVASGVNIYSESDTTVGKASKVTLQVVGMSTALNISAAERPGSAALSEAVIDLTESSVDTVILGALSSAAVSTKNTILGANVQSTIMVGSNASNANYVQAGAAGAYLLHEGTAKTSLVGGAASDTIKTDYKGDYVFGGTGADYFYDGAVQIQDYNYSEGDIIVAHNLGTAGVQLSQIALAKNRININAGGEVTIGSAADAEVYAAAIAGNDGNTLATVLWTGASGTTLTASDYTNKGAIINANADTVATAVDYIVGTSAADTIVVGAGDTILAGAGNDSIIVANNPKSAGAMIQLAAGKNTVEGWKYGFNYESGGSNILYAKASNLDFKSGNGYAVVYSGNNSLTFADSGNSGAYEIVTRSGSTYTNMTFIANGGSASVTSSDSLSGYYVGEGKNASLTFTSAVDTDLGALKMTSSTLTGITYLDVSNNGKATVMGTSGAETLKVSGETRKYASLGAGNDYIISGGNTSSRYDKAGNTFYFGTSDGRDTITGFSYWLGSSVDSDQDYADIIRVSSSPTAVKRTSNGVEVSLSSSARVVIAEDTASSDAANDMILLKVKNASAKAIKVGSSSSNNNFTYNDSVSAYYGNTARGQDTLTVGDDAAVTKINLNSTSTYQGIKDVDASAAVTSSRLTIYGKSSTNNVITGGTTQTRMWGRSGNNTLIGGTGADQFVAYGSGAYNTFKNYDESQGDLVWLYKSSLSNLLSRGIDTDNKTISLTFKNGSTVTIDDIASGTTNVKVRIGSSYYNANLETGKWSKTTA